MRILILILAIMANASIVRVAKFHSTYKSLSVESSVLVKKDMLTAYPNPCKGYVVFNKDNVNVYDMRGRIVSTNKKLPVGNYVARYKKLSKKFTVVR